jgi:hypothetical protein
VRRQPGNRPPGEPDVARTRLVDAGDHVEYGGLARAVRPDQADDLPLADAEVKFRQRPQAAEGQ